MSALVDPEDWVSINRKNWRAKRGRGGWYALKILVINGKKKYIYLHRLIMKTPKDMICHHRFKHTLDDRKSQLQNVTPAEHEQISQMLKIARIEHGPSNTLS